MRKLSNLYCWAKKKVKYNPLRIPLALKDSNHWGYTDEVYKNVKFWKHFSRNGIHRDQCMFYDSQ